MSKTSKAIVLKEPYVVKLENVPRPEIQESTDVIIEVHLAGLCGMFFQYIDEHSKAIQIRF